MKNKRVIETSVELVHSICFFLYDVTGGVRAPCMNDFPDGGCQAPIGVRGLSSWITSRTIIFVLIFILLIQCSSKIKNKS